MDPHQATDPGLAAFSKLVKTLDASELDNEARDILEEVRKALVSPKLDPAESPPSSKKKTPRTDCVVAVVDPVTRLFASPASLVTASHMPASAAAASSSSSNKSRRVDAHDNDDSSSCDDSGSEHNELCEVCSLGGELLCCDTCSLVFHTGCCRPELPHMPKAHEAWSCAYCVVDGTARRMAYGPSVAKGCIAEMVELAKERRFRGVVAKGHRFRAQIQINGRQINLGKFSSPAQAAQRYDQEARKAFGDRAKLNFPSKEEDEIEPDESGKDDDEDHNDDADGAHDDDDDDDSQDGGSNGDAADASKSVSPAPAEAKAPKVAPLEVAPGMQIVYKKSHKKGGGLIPVQVPIVEPKKSPAERPSHKKAADKTRAPSKAAGPVADVPRESRKRGPSPADPWAGGSSERARYGKPADRWLFSLESGGGPSSGALAGRRASGGGSGAGDGDKGSRTRHAQQRRPSEVSPRHRSPSAPGPPSSRASGGLGDGARSGPEGLSPDMAKRAVAHPATSKNVARDGVHLVKLLRSRTLTAAEVAAMDVLIGSRVKSALEAMKQALLAELEAATADEAAAEEEAAAERALEAQPTSPPTSPMGQEEGCPSEGKADSDGSEAPTSRTGMSHEDLCISVIAE